MAQITPKKVNNGFNNSQDAVGVNSYLSVEILLKPPLILS